MKHSVKYGTLSIGQTKLVLVAALDLGLQLRRISWSCTAASALCETQKQALNLALQFDDVKIPLEQRAHFYTWASPVCALCEANSPDTPNVRAVLRHCVPNKGLHPLRCLRSYPSTLCGGNNLLTQTVPAAKSDNPIPSARPSTENVGGLFSSHPSYPPHQKGGHVPCPNRKPSRN